MYQYTEEKKNNEEHLKKIQKWRLNRLFFFGHTHSEVLVGGHILRLKNGIKQIVLITA